MGPILFMRGMENEAVSLAVLLIRPEDQPRPTLDTSLARVSPRAVLERYGITGFLYEFELPMREDAYYEIEGQRHPVNAALKGDLSLAFVSCNGQEHGDLVRPREQRNAMWRRLAEQHSKTPLNLLLHGGDQIYADEILDAHPLTQQWGREQGDLNESAGSQMGDIVVTLRRALFQRYLDLYSQPETLDLFARVPSLSMWDDHDICDGWGSLPSHKLDSAIGQAVFSVAREHFLLFQLGASSEYLPMACIDRSGTSLTWQVQLPGLHLVAPDLRSERRRDRVMGPNGWTSLKTALSATRGGRLLLVSSVPALGPRLSLVEALMRLTPIPEKYEDDLRDQWQSRTHREEWRAFLKALVEVHEMPGNRVTIVSGEIHLATRGTLTSSNNPLHQLVASGIAHRAPPQAYARALGWLARLGEAPLRGHRLQLHPLPGQSAIYTAQRNYLMLAREMGSWQAWWELEDDGPTSRLQLD